MRKSILLIFFLLTSIPLFAGADLTGKWNLNKEQSDNAEEKLKKAMSESSRGGRGMRMRRQPDFGNRDGGPMSQLKMPETITIEYTDPELRITGEDLKRIYYTDGRKTEKEVDGPRGNVNIITQASWQEERLVIETQGGMGGKTVITYEVAPDKKQLFVKAQIKPFFSEEPIHIRYVYDLVQ